MEGSRNNAASAGRATAVRATAAASSRSSASSMLSSTSSSAEEEEEGVCPAEIPPPAAPQAPLPLPLLPSVIVRVVYAGRPSDLARLARTADRVTRQSSDGNGGGGGGSGGSVHDDESLNPAALALDGGVGDGVATVLSAARGPGETGQVVGAGVGAEAGSADVEAATVGDGTRGGSSAAAVELIRSEVRVADSDIAAAGGQRSAGDGSGSASVGAAAAATGLGLGLRSAEQLRLQVGERHIVLLFIDQSISLIGQPADQSITKIING